MTKHGDPMRFLERLVLEPSDECVPWPYAMNGRGYGHLVVAGRYILAGRQALIMATGRNPSEMVARHGACHDRRCVNPRHLSWGTQADNARDKLRDGTHNAGEAHHRARLSEADVAEIRQLAAAGWSQRHLAEHFGVSRGHISGIVTGRYWKHAYTMEET